MSHLKVANIAPALVVHTRWLMLRGGGLNVQASEVEWDGDDFAAFVEDRKSV